MFQYRARLIGIEIDKRGDKDLRSKATPESPTHSYEARRSGLAPTRDSALFTVSRDLRVLGSRGRGRGWDRGGRG